MNQIFKKISLIAVCLIFFCTTAHADSHNIKGCIYVFDTRSDSTTVNTNVPVPGLTINTWYSILGVDIPAIGSVTTNSSGCFSETLSGFTVPEVTTISVGPLMETDNALITAAAFPNSIYNYKITKTVTVSKGATADFGDMAIVASNGVDHGVFLLARGAFEVIKQYEAKVEPWSGYPKFSVGFPLTARSTAYTAPIFGIFIPDIDTSLDQETLFHEWGHWLADQDQFGVSIPASYCLNYSGGTYPYNTTSYTYTDPSSPPDCIHEGFGYEDADVASTEGYAEFISALLMGRDPTFPNDPALGFFGQHNENYVENALLDLVDATNESKTYMHAYQNAGSTHLQKIAPTSSGATLEPMTADAKFFYGVRYDPANPAAIYKTIYRSSLTYGGATTALYNTTVTSPILSVRVDALNHLCAVTQADGLFCGDTKGTTMLNSLTGPAGTPYGITLVNGEIYLLVMEASYYKIYHATLSRGRVMWTVSAWTLIYSEPTSATIELDINSIAVDSTNTTLYIARDDLVDSCSIASCTPAHLLGSDTTYGYRRGARAQTLLHNIADHSISWANGALYISDVYGVSRFLPSTGMLEQYFVTDPSISPIYDNNGLHRLSVHTFQPSFVTNGTQSVGKDGGGAASDKSYYYIDDSQPTTVEYYCGQDTATLPAADVVHMWTGHDYNGSDFKTAIDFIPGMTAGIKKGVENINWIELNKSGTPGEQSCPAWVDGEESYAYGTTPTSSSASSSRTKKSGTSGACIGNEDPDAQHVQPGSEQPEPAQPLTTKSVKVNSLTKTYPAAKVITGK